MKIRSTIPFPLGPFDTVSRDTAMDLIGQKFPAVSDSQKRIGDAKVIDVDWRNNQEVYIEIEMEIPLGYLGRHST